MIESCKNTVSVIALSVALVFGHQAMAGEEIVINGKQPPPTLDQLVGNTPGIQDGKSSFAFNAVHEIGYSYGMRGGLAFESKRIADWMEAKAESMDRVFNFQPVMIAGGVVPPVLVETTDAYSSTDGNYKKIADVVYKIERPAYFSSTPPNWRTYMVKAFHFNANNIGGWQPRSSEERDVWTAAVKAGWKQGVSQAHEIFEANFSRLSRDLSGMILFNELLDRKLVSAPVIENSTVAVSGGGDMMSINQTTAVIESGAKLKPSPQQWKNVEISR